MDPITKDYLLIQLNEFFDGDHTMMDEWLHTALPILNQERPADLMDTEVGRRRLLGVIGEMRNGEMA
ncbi:MAG: hypothetical protein CL587_02135 [Alteromonadaceae bacterium]|nr:hypothetical protein [Alteromonadaceae bacterium]